MRADISSGRSRSASASSFSVCSPASCNCASIAAGRCACSSFHSSVSARARPSTCTCASLHGKPLGRIRRSHDGHAAGCRKAATSAAQLPRSTRSIFLYSLAASPGGFVDLARSPCRLGGRQAPRVRIDGQDDVGFRGRAAAPPPCAARCAPTRPRSRPRLGSSAMIRMSLGPPCPDCSSRGMFASRIRWRGPPRDRSSRRQPARLFTPRQPPVHGRPAGSFRVCSGCAP